MTSRPASSLQFRETRGRTSCFGLITLVLFVFRSCSVRVPSALVVLTPHVFVFSESRSRTLRSGLWRPPVRRNQPTEFAQLYPIRKVPGAIFHVDRYACWVNRHYTKTAKPVCKRDVASYHRKNSKAVV